MHRIAATAVVAIAAALAALPAVAGPVPDPPVYFGATMQQRSYASCTPANACSVAFSPVAAGHQMMVTDVSCDAQVFSSTFYVVQSLLRLTSAGGGSSGRAAYLTPIQMASTAGIKHYRLSEPVKLVVNAGETPQLSIALNGTASTVMLDCTLTASVR
ncbi:hypothetical protein [Oharaeibacter diazotrophicus]|uniref:Uncharacterized protein n=1 Tax=Oharaeibacter diazotrophicus TaxID=1920512 RepID=A0A4R6RDZ1_9HYPH|nr:hypothetical protein [Oharaeibacter diazotrophicus]TDP84382.1 hypothetical protein EDD54_2989 [Oharaeibacter diazotrophicus]BBE73420.1 hypothetical protein OHA_1_03031 [Pleomorphomonas sp. SM30]GLS75211.1 hypothetical protein GCM10007904_05460 [Oharaeibacter diazotrophicus]